VKAAACPDSQDLRECPANREDPANQERQEPQVPQANHQRRRVSPPLLHHASLAHKDPQDSQDHPDLPESPERPAPQEDREPTRRQDPPDLEDLPDHPERPDPSERRESQECPPLPSHSLPESLESQEMSDHRDTPAHQDLPAATAHPEHPDPRESQDQMELPAQTELQDQPDHPDPEAPPEKRVSARNTAPPTEECSSRTELVVERRQPYEEPMESTQSVSSPAILFFNLARFLFSSFIVMRRLQ